MGRMAGRMGLQLNLKENLKQKNYNTENISFKESLEMSANDRYQFTIAKITKTKIVYTFSIKNDCIFFDSPNQKAKVLLIWPDEESIKYCKEKDESFKDLHVLELSIKDLYHNELKFMHKKKIFVGVYTNLIDIIEVPSLTFKIDWFNYMFYTLKQDWMFDD